MPTNEKLNENTKIYDKNVARFAKRIAAAYGDAKVRLLASRDVRRAVLLRDIDAINNVIAKVPQMSAGLRLDFCDAFVGEDMSGLDLATPAILADAYRAISARVKEGDAKQQERLDKIAARIDDLSADFANSGGMVVSQNEWPLVDMSNIANIYEGFGNMLDARIVDVDVDKNPEKVAEMQANKKQIETVVSDYDGSWGLGKLRAEDAPKLADRWDEIYAMLNRAKIFDETKEKTAKCKFLDARGNIIPQFKSNKRGDTKRYEEYDVGFDIAKDGRLASIVELARHNVAKRHVANFDDKIDEDTLESELNEEILSVLYEVYAADQVAQDATKTPEQFSDPEFRAEFMTALNEMGKEISDNGYNVAIETQTDATVGWAARIKSKLGAATKKLDGLWTRANRPLDRIDDMADVRMSRGAVARRKKRREFCWRILKGFNSSFIVSALITVIAAAAAARLGVSLASGLAMIGGGLALGMIGFQVARWIKNQKKNNLPVSLEEFFKDKQLVRSIVTSALAIAAMGLGAAGLGAAAMTVGVGAALLGAYNNGRGVFEAARDVKMSHRQRIAWAIANAGSVIAGALGGGYVGRGLVSMFNRLYPGNTFFQNKETVEGPKRKVSDEITHERTTRHYTDDMLRSAKDAVEDWYAHDYPNHPEILQQDIDAVNQYNADHDTNLDPYRILRAMKTSQPSRLVYTEGWTNAHNISQETIAQAANAVGGGTYNPAGIESARLIDANMGTQGEVGPVGDFTNKTYSPITELPTDKIETVVDQPAVYEQTYNDTYKPVDVKPGYGAFGNYTPRERINDRIASFLDRVRRGRRAESKPTLEPKPTYVPPITSIKEPADKKLQGFESDTKDKKPTYVPPITHIKEHADKKLPDISLDRVFPKPAFDDTEGHLRRIRDAYRDLKTQDVPVAPEKTDVAPKRTSVLAVTYARAKKWDELHDKLDEVRNKIMNSALGAAKSAELRAQEKNIIHKIEHLYNYFGRPSMDELGAALANAYRREYVYHMRAKPDEKHSSHKTVRDWNEKHERLLKKMELYGWDEPLDGENLDFAAPVMGVQAQKQVVRGQKYEQERLQREEAEQQKVKNLRLPVLMYRPEKKKNRRFHKPFEQEKPIILADLGTALENVQAKDGQQVGDRKYFVPDALRNLAGNKNLFTEPLIEIRGVPVNLIDLTGQNNPITQSENRVMVMVDVDGLRMPFFLANGDEKFENIKPGKWYPAFDLSRDGSWRFWKTAEYLDSKRGETSEKIDEISKTLNEVIGDIRNYRDTKATTENEIRGFDGFVGGVDAFDRVDPDIIVNMTEHQPNDLGKYMYWLSLGDKMTGAYVPYIKWYFENIKSPDYAPEEKNWLDEIIEKHQDTVQNVKSTAKNVVQNVKSTAKNVVQNVKNTVQERREKRQERRQERRENRSGIISNADVENVLPGDMMLPVSEPVQKPIEKHIDEPKPVEPVVAQNGLGTVLETAIYKNEHDTGGEHKVPESLIDLARRPDIFSTPITTIRGVPVKLVDITGHNNPFTQSENRAMVIVDVNGQRLPFYLANGNERGVTGVAGVWRPVLTLDRTGRWYINSNDHVDSKELNTIINALNEHIGDIRNYRDKTATHTRMEITGDKENFVGGVDAIDQVDPNKILDIIRAGNTTNDDDIIWWPYGGGASWHAKPGAVAKFLRGVESPDYRRSRGFLEKLEEGLGRRFKRFNRDKKYE